MRKDKRLTTTFEIVEKTREYLDYIEEHYFNVQKAWEELQEKCKDMRFIHDDFFYFTINNEIRTHDYSKLSEQEFVQYRKQFYPTEDEKDQENKLIDAWEHHKNLNPHHWQNWTKKENKIHPDEWEIHCVHMVCDWMAMGYKFGDNAQCFYESKKRSINLPDYAINLIYEIFKRLYEKG